MNQIRNRPFGPQASANASGGKFDPDNAVGRTTRLPRKSIQSPNIWIDVVIIGNLDAAIVGSPAA
jgi:hypothetical protein